MVLYCAQQLLGLKKKQKPFLHLSLSKAGPFTLGNHICIKALKCKVFQIIRCLIKPLLKNSTQTIFQGGTPWVAELLNNMNVWMVLYCAQQLLGLKKIKTLSPIVKFHHMQQMQADALCLKEINAFFFNFKINCATCSTCKLVHFFGTEINKS